MESYYRVSDVKAIIKKLLKEPAYYHDDKDFVVGVCTVGSELACLDILELEEPKYAQWKTREYRNDYLWVECSNCGFIVENYNAVKLGRSSTDVVDYKWHACPKCMAKMRLEN